MLVKRSPWNGRRVLVTGHTGFKGGWLALWLNELGAEVTGFALAPPTDPSFFGQVRLGERLTHIEGDIRDPNAVESAFQTAQPEVVFHLAAQSLVRPSYEQPVETFATNVMGTVNILESCRRSANVQSIVCATSDKCYENREWSWPYRETDALGGHDPYSASKGAAEIAIASYRRSFFADRPILASVRAGNVIGGGDWSEDRLVPDIVRAIASGNASQLRSPGSIRPWQHVLDALSGYLLLAERLLDCDRQAADAWNFGPASSDARSVGAIADAMIDRMAGTSWSHQQSDTSPHEAKVLTVDSSKAREILGWKPTMDVDEALEMTADWYRQVANGADPREVSLRQLHDVRLGNSQAVRS